MHNKNYDLHTHTLYSDGELTPEDLVSRAVDKKVTVLAITDHDTTKGLAPARRFIETNQLDIELIDGIEISTQWNKQEIHIVGLNIDPTHVAIGTLTQQQTERRMVRAELIAQKLVAKGFSDVYEQVKLLSQGDAISRTHFARYLINKGAVKEMDGAFKKYLGIGRVAYVATNWPTLQEAVKAIRMANGQAVLAHPSRYALTNKKLRQLLSDFKIAGGVAMEVSYARQSPAQRQFLLTLSQHYALTASQGSDFHCVGPWIELGRNIELPAEATPIWSNW